MTSESKSPYKYTPEEKDLYHVLREIRDFVRDNDIQYFSDLQDYVDEHYDTMQSWAKVIDTHHKQISNYIDSRQLKVETAALMEERRRLQEELEDLQCLQNPERHLN